MAESFVSFDEKYHINIIRKRQEGYRENIQRILRRKAKAMGEKILEYARWRSSRTGVTLKDMRRMGHPYRLSPGIISQGGGALRQRPSQVYIQNQMSMSGRPKKNPSFPIFSEGWKLRVYSSRKMKGDKSCILHTNILISMENFG